MPPHRCTLNWYGVRKFINRQFYWTMDYTPLTSCQARFILLPKVSYFFVEYLAVVTTFYIAYPFPRSIPNSHDIAEHHLSVSIWPLGTRFENTA